MNMDMAIDRLFARYPTPIGRAIQAAMRRSLAGALPAEDAAPVLLALGEATGDRAIAEAAAGWMAALGFGEALVVEARQAAALAVFRGTCRAMGVPADDPPVATGLGDDRLARIAFAVAIALGDVPSDAGIPVAARHDLARLAAAVRAASRLP